MESKFDFSSFKKDNSADLACKRNANYLFCESMNRLFNALQIYTTLNIINNQNDREFFDKFMHEIYDQLVNDYIHFNNHHTHQLEAIHNDIINNKSILNPCQISECKFTLRHHGHISKVPKYILNPALRFYQRVMDSIHFYLFHCFDVGLRVLKAPQSEYQEEETKNEDKYFDSYLSRVHKIIQQRQHLTASFDRFKSDKFEISPTLNENVLQTSTAADKLVKYLNRSILHEGLEDFLCFIRENEYDTDSFELDIKIQPGNIANFAITTKNNDIIQEVTTFILMKQYFSSSYVSGLRFYYWDFYRQLQHIPYEEQSAWNQVGHLTYNICDLFVVSKYSSFKEEILHYKHGKNLNGDLTVNIYRDHVLFKVNKYMISDIVKQTKAAYVEYLNHHYEIARMTPIQRRHLISLVLYTDFSYLSSDFSKSLRPRTYFEHVIAIKGRNSKYHYLSKYLRETVEIYGKCRYEDDDNPGLKGPFYCGLSVVVHLPQFNITLCSPTSTTKLITVAMTFSGRDGMILQLNNNCQGKLDTLRAFDASWISEYREEMERIYFGGYHLIQVESVRIRKTNQNFEEIIHGLCYLDNMITGAKQEQSGKRVPVAKKHIELIKNLFSQILNKYAKKQYDQYVLSSFYSFTLHKQQIILDLHELSIANKTMKDIILYELDKRWPEDEVVRNYNDFSNLFRKQMVFIFKNTESIIITTTSSDGYYSYSISMIALLCLMEHSSLQQVIVKAFGKYENNWIYSLWCKDSSMLKEYYQKQKWVIKLQPVGTEYWFSIDRI
eukprot:546154_1